MKKLFVAIIPLLLLCVFICGCTGISEEFKKEISSTNELMFSTFDKIIRASMSSNAAAVISNSKILNQDVISAYEQIEKMQISNETIKTEYLRGLRKIRDATTTLSEDNMWIILASNKNYYVDAYSLLIEGMGDITTVESYFSDQEKVALKYKEMAKLGE